MPSPDRKKQQRTYISEVLSNGESRRIFEEALAQERDMYFPENVRTYRLKKSVRMRRQLVSSVKFASTGLIAIAGVFVLSNHISTLPAPLHFSFETTGSVSKSMTAEYVFDEDAEPVAATPKAVSVNLDMQPTGSVQSDSRSLPSEPLIDLAKLPDCQMIAAPPKFLETESKYVQSDPTKSTIDEVVLTNRNSTMKPIRDSVRLLTQIAYAESRDVALQVNRAQCVIKNLKTWATESSLTEMNTMDAVLNRDRFVAEIGLALLQIDKVHPLEKAERDIIFPWLSMIAKDTIQNYTYNVGRISQSNNHRYWAGLAVAAIGYATRQPDFIKWGRGSFEIGICEIDTNGYLPLELRRGSKALQYHVYALRPLLAIVKLSADHGDTIDSQCGDRLQRLINRTVNAIKDKTEMETASGFVQELYTEEKTFSKGLQLASLGISTNR